MGDGSRSDYSSWEVATTGKLADLTFDGKNVIDEKKFWSEPLGLGSLGGVNKMEFAKVVESGKTVVTFSTEDNMEVHGDLDVQGDLVIDGKLTVHGEITTDFLHVKTEEKEAEVAPEDEVFLNPQELTVLQIGLDQVTIKPLADSLEISDEEAIALLRSVYEKLIY
jgi:hypothetical protein